MTLQLPFTTFSSWKESWSKIISVIAVYLVTVTELSFPSVVTKWRLSVFKRIVSRVKNMAILLFCRKMLMETQFGKKAEKEESGTQKAEASSWRRWRCGRMWRCQATLRDINIYQRYCLTWRERGGKRKNALQPNANVTSPLAHLRVIVYVRSAGPISPDRAISDPRHVSWLNPN